VCVLDGDDVRTSRLWKNDVAWKVCSGASREGVQCAGNKQHN